MDVSTLQELEEAFSQVRNRKAAGTDSMYPDLLKYDSIKRRLLTLISICWRKRSIPRDWVTGECNIFIQLVRVEASNYRGINHIKHWFKLNAKIVTESCRYYMSLQKPS